MKSERAVSVSGGGPILCDLQPSCPIAGASRRGHAPGMLADSWVQTLRGWCKQFSAVAEALERGDFHWFEDGQDKSLERAAKYRKQVAGFERVIADSIAAPAQPV